MLCIASPFVILLKSNLDVQHIHIWGWFVEQKLMLGSSFRYDQIYKYPKYDFGHTLFVTLKSDLDVQ